MNIENVRNVHDACMTLACAGLLLTAVFAVFAVVAKLCDGPIWNAVLNISVAAIWLTGSFSVATLIGGLVSDEIELQIFMSRSCD